MVQTLISIAPKVVPLVYDILEKDSNHEYGLRYNADYGVIRTTHFKAFDYIDDVLVVEKVDDERSHWWIKAFEPGKGYWDGTSLLPDKGKIGFLNFDALFKASLFHDVVYKKVEALSKATGVPEEKLLAFADDMLDILAEGYGASKKMARPIHSIVRFGGSLYHKLKKIIGVFLIATLCGCYSLQTEMEGDPPEIITIGPVLITITNAIHDAQISLLTNSVPQNDKIIVPTEQSPSTTILSDSTADSKFKIVSFGSPNVSKASETDSAQISNLKMDRNGLSYRWTKGGSEQLGATSESDYDHTIAVAGYSDDGKTFRCAKFDWISTSRKTRNFRNIYEHYNGFDSDKLFVAKKRCFFIMGIDGKRRTNILTD